jgi:hypothetical protein
MTSSSQEEVSALDWDGERWESKVHDEEVKRPSLI